MWFFINFVHFNLLLEQYTIEIIDIRLLSCRHYRKYITTLYLVIMTVTDKYNYSS